MMQDKNKQEYEERIKRKKKTSDNPDTDYDESELDAMNDKYDVIKLVTTVKSPISTMNPDFIMSDLSPEILTNPVSKYVRTNLNHIEMINIYLNEQGDEEARKNINQIMLNSVYSLVNISRADKAKVILAILDYIKNNEGGVQTTPTTEPQEEGILSRLNPFKNKNEAK